MNRIDQSHRRKLSKTNHRQTLRLSDIALLCENKIKSMEETKSEGIGKEVSIKLIGEKNRIKIIFFPPDVS